MTDSNATWEAINDAWDALYDSLPARWKIGKPSYDPSRRAWSVTAWGPRRGSGRTPPSVTGIGDDEVAALRDLDCRLRAEPQPNVGGKQELSQRLRLAFVDGAEAAALEHLGRRLTRDELGLVIERYASR
jgi:hypothetical protein